MRFYIAATAIICACLIFDGIMAYTPKTTTTATRREALTKTATAFFGAAASTATFPLSAYAKPAYPQEESDKQKILEGYKRLNYLLDNWEKETTVCGRFDNPYIGDGNGCERTPDKVMGYLGYKNTDDPLFRIDKTLTRLQNLTDDPAFGDILDNFLEQADNANITAYVSSWGESNPGGGKDRVEYWIERSKSNVKIARDNLGTVIRILDLKV